MSAAADIVVLGPGADAGGAAGLRAFYAGLGFADDGRRILSRAIAANPA